MLIREMRRNCFLEDEENGKKFLILGLIKLSFFACLFILVFTFLLPLSLMDRIIRLTIVAILYVFIWYLVIKFDAF
jgi:hypothetical protein